MLYGIRYHNWALRQDWMSLTGCSLMQGISSVEFHQKVDKFMRVRKHFDSWADTP